MEIYVPDSKVIKEALEIVSEVYDSQQVEKLILKLCRLYKGHCEYSGCGWYTIAEYVNKQYKAEDKEDSSSNL